jgi:hypothetical protein
MEPVDPDTLEVLESFYGGTEETACALGISTRQYQNYRKQLLAPRSKMRFITLLVRTIQSHALLADAIGRESAGPGVQSL